MDHGYGGYGSPAAPGLQAMDRTLDFKIYTSSISALSIQDDSKKTKVRIH